MGAPEINIPCGQSFFSRNKFRAKARIRNNIFLCLWDDAIGISSSSNISTRNASPNEVITSLKGILRKLKEKGSSPKSLKGIIVYPEEESISEIKNFCHSLKLNISFQLLESNSSEVCFDSNQHKVLKKKIIRNNQKEEVKILIIDDSPSIRKVLKRMLEKEKDITVIGEASNAVEGLSQIEKLRPDVITLDINMPGKSGVEFYKEYSKIYDIPTIVISSISVQESHDVLDLLEAGVFDYFEKPSFDKMNEHTTSLIKKIKQASKAQKQPKKKEIKKDTPIVRIAPKNYKRGSLIVLGASTGGTEALKEVLIQLPKDIPPILIVQHIPPIFSKAFADRLDKVCAPHVVEAQDGDTIRAGMVYIAPGNKHMKVIQEDSQLKISLTMDEPVNRFRPSVDVLFNSVSELKSCKNVVASLLTGMGHDGARGLLNLKQRGAFTLVQNEESSVVFGMPRVAIELEAHNKIISLKNMAYSLIKYLP